MARARRPRQAFLAYRVTVAVVSGVGLPVGRGVGEGVTGVAVITTNAVGVNDGVAVTTVRVADGLIRTFTDTGVIVAVPKVTVPTFNWPVVPVLLGPTVTVPGVPVTPAGTIVRVCPIVAVAVITGNGATVAVPTAVGTITPRGGTIPICVDPTAVRTDAVDPAPVASATIVRVDAITALLGIMRMVHV